jgi:hypothetical protein
MSEKPVKKVVKKVPLKKEPIDKDDLEAAIIDNATAKSTSDFNFKKEFEDLKNELTEVKTIVKGFKKELKGLVEIQQRLVHERLSAPLPPPPKEYGEEITTKGAKINITSIDGDRIRISGNTFDFRTAIKNAGIAKWEGGTKSWSLPSECLDQLIQNLEAVNLVRDTDFSVNVKDNTGVNGDSESSKKRAESEDGGFGSGFAD